MTEHRHALCPSLVAAMQIVQELELPPIRIATCGHVAVAAGIVCWKVDRGRIGKVPALPQTVLQRRPRPHWSEAVPRGRKRLRLYLEARGARAKGFQGQNRLPLAPETFEAKSPFLPLDSYMAEHGHTSSSTKLPW